MRQGQGDESKREYESKGTAAENKIERKDSDYGLCAFLKWLKTSKITNHHHIQRAQEKNQTK